MNIFEIEKRLDAIIEASQDEFGITEIQAKQENILREIKNKLADEAQNTREMPPRRGIPWCPLLAK